MKIDDSQHRKKKKYNKIVITVSACSVVTYLKSMTEAKLENEVTLGLFLSHTVSGLQLWSSAFLASLCGPNELGHLKLLQTLHLYLLVRFHYAGFL